MNQTGVPMTDEQQSNNKISTRVSQFLIGFFGWLILAGLIFFILFIVLFFTLSEVPIINRLNKDSLITLMGFLMVIFTIGFAAFFYKTRRWLTVGICAAWGINAWLNLGGILMITELDWLDFFALSVPFYSWILFMQ